MTDQGQQFAIEALGFPLGNVAQGPVSVRVEDVVEGEGNLFKAPLGQVIRGAVPHVVDSHFLFTGTGDDDERGLRAQFVPKAEGFRSTAVGKQVVRTDEVRRSSGQGLLEFGEGFDAANVQVASALGRGALEDGGIDVVVLQVQEVEGGLRIPVQQGVAPLVRKGSATLVLHQPTMDP